MALRQGEGRQRKGDGRAGSMAAGWQYSVLGIYKHLSRCHKLLAAYQLRLYQVLMSVRRRPSCPLRFTLGLRPCASSTFATESVRLGWQWWVDRRSYWGGAVARCIASRSSKVQPPSRSRQPRSPHPPPGSRSCSTPPTAAAAWWLLLDPAPGRPLPPPRQRPAASPALAADQSGWCSAARRRPAPRHTAGRGRVPITQ